MRCKPWATAAKLFIAPTPRKPTSSSRPLRNTSGRLCHSIRPRLPLRHTAGVRRRQKRPSMRRCRRPNETASYRNARSSVPLAGLRHRRVRTLHLHGGGLAIAAAHHLDSNRWLLAQTASTTTYRETTADHHTDQSNTATAAAKRWAEASQWDGWGYSSIRYLSPLTAPAGRARVGVIGWQQISSDECPGGHPSD